MNDSELTHLESAVLHMMLAGEQPVFAALRAQLSGIRVKARENTGVGFFIDLVTAGPSAEVPGRHLRVGDVQASIRGLKHGAGFVLSIEEGLITMLEGYSYDEPWPEELELIALDYTDPTRASMIAALTR